MINKIISKQFEGALYINTMIDADQMYECLERALHKNNKIVIVGNMHNHIATQVTMAFLEKYKSLLDFFYTDVTCLEGNTYVQFKTTINNSFANTSAEIEDYYTADYYLNDCGGYDEFKSSEGMVIDQRLQDVMNLVNPQKGDKILDIGCGRGELTFALANEVAYVEGVDYSADAIEIAQKTYAGTRENLAFVQADVCKMDNMGTFDKIVMADVVEHIEQDGLQRIFEKISTSMSEEGVLVIHTAPNKDFYDFCYPAKREEARKIGGYLPPNPRSYYEQLMHINEQTPKQLEDTLCKSFKFVRVWTGNVMEIAEDKNFASSCQDNQIFAYACNQEAVINKIVEEITKHPSYDQCRVEIEADNIQAGENATEVNVAVILKNKGVERITSRRKYPIHLSYHIYDENGEIIVYDGERTGINNVLRQGQSLKTNMKLLIPAGIHKKQLFAKITLVAEECFWFDQEGMNCKDICINLI